MKQFQTIEKLDTGILYCLELASSMSVLLLTLEFPHRKLDNPQAAQVD